MALADNLARAMPILRKIPGRNAPANPLARFAGNVHSQCGEDGILQHILRTIPPASLTRWVVEFGAWDGQHLSNSLHLIQNHNFSAVLIEGNPDKFKQLQATHAQRPHVSAINAMVGLQGDSTLDQLLSTTPLPRDFDLVSIDIDGLDWHVWQSLSTYSPRALVIEFNPTIPNDVFFVQDPDPRISQGNSLAAMIELGKSKGYELVCALKWNAFFVRREFYSLFGIADNSIDAMHDPSPYVTSVFQCFDGTWLNAGLRQMLWQSRKFGAEDLKLVG
jgi:hypothetical protein